MFIDVGGRRLEVLVAGPDGGPVLVLHLGTPAGPVDTPVITGPAAERGLRTVICARPGYAGSTPRPGRTVADVAEDVTAVLDRLGADRFVTLGWSGGGPHALACAALLPGRCAAAATLAGVAPYGAAGLDWLAGMGPENVEEFGAAAAGPEALEAFLDRAAAGLAAVSGDEVAAALGGLASPVDAAALTGAFAESLAAGFRSAVSSGTAGWRDDDLAFVRPWGFDPSAIAVPVVVWQGGQDRMVPPGHGEWLATHVPGARARLDPDAGHISMAGEAGALLDDLLSSAGWTR
ncbi:alpha/beta fold hydrolase [Dactylosporangium sp. CA-139066]|uniref:alpha/beta fold hydrolase n=1 Tax=Dactylosporangium sp. CA-139066 TaxID=3239930 RepID=UPI003D9485F7